MKRISILLVVFFLGLVFTGVGAEKGDATTPTDSVAAPILTETEQAYQFKLDSMRLELQAQTEGALFNDSHVRSELPAVIGVFVPIIMALGGAFVLYRIIDSKKKVRLAMIEKGMDPTLLDQPTDESSRKYSALRFGLLLTGVGFGLLVGWTASEMLYFSEDRQALVVVASALTFGGLGLVTYHLIVSKIERKS